MNWDTIKLFLALYREGSARAVANQCDVSPSTVTRRISDLEKELKVKLFNRHATGFELTEYGHELLLVALRMESDAFEIERKLQAKNSFMQGNIRITIPYHIMVGPFVKGLAKFSEIHPRVDLDIVPSWQAFDLKKGEADIALRLLYRDKMPPDDLIGSKIFEIYCAVYASKTYLQSHDLNDSDMANFIGWDDNTAYPDWVMNSEFPHLRTKHKFNDPILQLQAVKAGMGLAMMPCFLCDGEPDLVRVHESSKWHRFDVWMLSHPDLRETMRYREMRNFLKKYFMETTDVWTGDSYVKKVELS